jgi:hypothetical protein
LSVQVAEEVEGEDSFFCLFVFGREVDDEEGPELDRETGTGKKVAEFRKSKGCMQTAHGSSELPWLRRPKGESEKESINMKLRWPSPSSQGTA